MTDGGTPNLPDADAPQAEAPQIEAPQIEAPQIEAPQADAPRTDAPGTDAPAERRGTSAAQAASRARRIGGRPTPGPRPAPGRRPTPGPAAEPEDAQAKHSATQLTKPLTKQRPKPALEAEPTRPRRRKTAVDAARTEQPEKPERKARKARAARTPRTHSISWWPVAVVAVIAIALIGVDVWKGGVNPYRWFVTSSSSNAQDREQLIAETKTNVSNVLAYDYRTIDAGAAKAEAGMLDPFKSTYAKSVATVVKPQAVQIKAIVTATIENAGIVSISGNGKQAVLLVYAQQAVQNSTTGGTPRLDIATVQVTENKVGGHWLISNLARV